MTLRALYDVPAPAKLNLFLHIVGRRADGYHLLQSVFVLIDWCDTLHFERRQDGRLARHDLGDELPHDDLCLRAARALQQASGCPAGADIHIAKRVPSAAGMGGGSSDAATTLLALNRLWGLGWPRQRLADIGLQLGADVPFFIGGQNALVEGIGEKLTPLPLPPACYAVLKPPQGIATRDVFSHPALKREMSPVILAGSPEEAEGNGVAPDQMAGWADRFGANALQGPAEERCPEVAQAARLLSAQYGNSRMTGSGSAVFARAGTIESPLANIPAHATQVLEPGWVGRMCRSLLVHPLRDWAAG
jgi:4-diphosphocytidyl-2-C-methyl-D-erythritol kinase